ncbi:MAG: TonB-dependent receptor [Candidatus Binatia bacterium]
MLAVLVWAAISVRPCAAVDTPPAPGRELLLFEEPPVSAAAKHLQPTGEAPAAVTVITRDDIRHFGYRTLAEALRGVGGFYTSSDRVYSYVGVRGFLRSGDYNDRILLLVDGHTYNEDIYHTAYLGNEFGIDLEAIDHIEVIRGPGSALYGGNATFAVVNVVTLAGKDAPGLQALVETGSFGRKRGQMSWGYSDAARGLDVFMSGSVLDLDGQPNLYYPDYDSPATHHGVAHDGDAERAFNLFSSIRYGDVTVTGGANSRDKHDPTGAFEVTFDDPGTKSRDQRQFADVAWARDLPYDLHVGARAYYDGTTYHGTYIYGAGAGRIKNEDLAHSDWVGGEAQGRWQGLPRNTVTVGSEYAFHPGATQESFYKPSGQRILHDERTWASWGVYAQDEVALHRTLTLIGGLRFDEVYYGQFREVSPRGALVWTPVASTRVKLLYGRAFRPPNLYEQYYAFDESGGMQLGNSHLEPEKITTYEAVVEHDFWGRARGSLALYRYDLAKLMDQVSVRTATGTALQFENGLSATANGAEAELRIPLPNRMTLRLDYAYQEARDDDGRLLTNSPQHLGDVAFFAPLPFGLELGTDLEVVGPRLTRDRRSLPIAHLVNVTLNYRTPIPRLAFGLGLYNLFDQTYPDPAGADHRQDRIAQDGLTFRLQMRYAF